MKINYIEIGICGLSCRLCPTYHAEGKSRCGGCKSEYRMGSGCPFITCAVKKREIEFCWICTEKTTCDRWSKHRAFGREHDTFTSYQSLEDNIAFLQERGADAFDGVQVKREQLLMEMLNEFNEGRSKRFYCIAAAVMQIDELESALMKAREESGGLNIVEKAGILHSTLGEIAEKNRYHLKLRK
jgi:hypothetical protein